MSLSREEKKLIRDIVAVYGQHRSAMLQTFLDQLKGLLLNPGNGLPEHVHSFKWRIKEPSHLKEKLERKWLKAKGEGKPFEITPENLFIKVNDLVGFRILHLYSKQLKEIDHRLRALLAEAQLRIVEGPFARTWDDENKASFASLGIETRESGPSMYTSVHYIIDSNSRTKYTAEIQVRTLAEELWGEVAHVIDYPEPTKILACREQVRVLARVASSCTRLVDSIFNTEQDHRAKLEGNSRRSKRRAV